MGDCAPKHLRTQFICALLRVALVEEKRKGDTRSHWFEIDTTFPEMEWWREVRWVIKKRATAVETKASKWDNTEANTTSENILVRSASEWAKSYQEKLREVFKRQYKETGGGDVVNCMHPELRALAVDIWRDIVEWY